MGDDAASAAAKLATLSKVTTGLKITGIVLNAVGIVFDIISIVTVSINIHKGNITQEAIKLRRMADDIEGNGEGEDE